MDRSIVLFKAILFVTKTKNKKSSQALLGMFFNPQFKCSEVSGSPILKSTPPFSIAPSILKNMSTLWSESTHGINKQCQLPLWSFKFNLNNIFSRTFVYTYRVLFLSRMFVEFYLKLLYSADWKKCSNSCSDY